MSPSLKPTFNRFAICCTLSLQKQVYTNSYQSIWSASNYELRMCDIHKPTRWRGRSRPKQVIGRQFQGKISPSHLHPYLTFMISMDETFVVTLFNNYNKRRQDKAVFWKRKRYKTYRNNYLSFILNVTWYKLCITLASKLWVIERKFKLLLEILIYCRNGFFL